MEDQTNNQAVATKPVEIDPYLLFKQIDAMREEGVPEETIKAAFNEFMNERSGNFRTLTPSIKKTSESTPMPSQEEINKMYEDRSAKEVMSEEMQLLMAEIEKAQERKAKAGRLTFRKIKDKFARFLLVKILRVIIFTFSLFGVK